MATLTIDERDFLTKDLQVVSSYLTAFASQRLTALGGCVTLIGALITFGNKEQFQLAFPTSLFQLVPMLLIVYATVRFIGAINRSVYVFNQHNANIETELGVVGFGSCWVIHAHQNPKDGNAHAYATVCRTINILVSGYGVLLAVVRDENVNGSANRGVCVGVFLLSIG